MVGFNIFLVEISIEYGTRHRKENAILSILGAAKEVCASGVQHYSLQRCDIGRYQCLNLPYLLSICPLLTHVYFVDALTAERL